MTRARTAAMTRSWSDANDGNDTVLSGDGGDDIDLWWRRQPTAFPVAPGTTPSMAAAITATSTGGSETLSHTRILSLYLGTVARSRHHRR